MSFRVSFQAPFHYLMFDERDMKIAHLGTFVRRLGNKNYKPLANKKLKTVPFLALDFSAF